MLPVVALLGGAIVSGHRPQIAVTTSVTIFSVIASQLGRDRGRRLEPDLWKGWGGSPTLQRMRFRSGRPAQLTERLHGRIAELLGDPLPTAADEQAEAQATDAQYDHAIARIRGLARDKNRFALLFSENVNYGFRRNLLGLRPIGITVDAAALVGSALLIGLTTAPFAHRVALYGPAAAISLLLIAFWLAAVSADWVRIPADAYADRLVEAVDVIARECPATQNTNDVASSGQPRAK